MCLKWVIWWQKFAVRHCKNWDFTRQQKSNHACWIQREKNTKINFCRKKHLLKFWWTKGENKVQTERGWTSWRLHTCFLHICLTSNVFDDLICCQNKSATVLPLMQRAFLLNIPWSKTYTSMSKWNDNVTSDCDSMCSWWDLKDSSTLDDLCQHPHLLHYLYLWSNVTMITLCTAEQKPACCHQF